MPESSKKKRNLVWLTVNSSYSHSSLALPLIHSYCCNISSWHWEHLETTVGEDPLETLCALERYAADLLCVQLYLFNRNYVMDIVERFHTLHPRTVIVAGGPECLGEGADALWEEYPFLTAIFRGEGEEEFRKFLENFDPEPPRGIFPPEENGIFRDWEHTFFPVKDPFFRKDKPFIQYESSRGCPMGCSYCTSGGTHYRCKELSLVEEELAALSDAGIREIRILDRTFNFPRERGVVLLRLFREKFPHIRFHLEVHPEFLDEALKAEFRKALKGQLHIEAGIQSLSLSVQRAIGRKSDPEKAFAGLAFLCSQVAFETHADLLAGLPGQSLEEIFEDAEKLMRIGTGEIQLEVLKILPGTVLAQTAGKEGIKHHSRPPYDVMTNGNMTPEAILLARKLSRLLDLTYNHKALHPVLLLMAEEKESMLYNLLEFFLAKALGLNTLLDLKKRFLLLAEYLSCGEFPRSEEVLAYEWIAAGYPLAETPFLTPEIVSGLPEKKLLLSGKEECLTQRETRFWLLPCREKKIYFAFNRKYSFNCPAGIWQEI